MPVAEIAREKASGFRFLAGHHDLVDRFALLVVQKELAIAVPVVEAAADDDHGLQTWEHAGVHGGRLDDGLIK